MTSQLQAEIDAINRSFPIMDRLGDYLESSGALKGARVGWHCHLTSLTAITAGALLRSGAELYMSECNRATTSPSAVVHMRQLGASVELGPSSPARVLEKAPDVISDVGLVLTLSYLESVGQQRHSHPVRGSCEITSSGISRLKELKKDEIAIPVININDGFLKSYIENFHGVGDGVVDLLRKISPNMWSGRCAAVFGYGRVGAGVAFYLRSIGMSVRVVEVNPVKRLGAHYDGFILAEKEQALSASEVIVTATGTANVITGSDWSSVKSGATVFNVGHWPEELDLDSLESMCCEQNELTEFIMEYIVESPGSAKKRISILAEGSPANVAMLTGSPEPTLIHLTTELLCMEHLFKYGQQMQRGENPLPPEVERNCADLALQVLSS